MHSRSTLFIRRAQLALKMFGINTAQTKRMVAGMPRYVADALAYRRADGDERFPLRMRQLFPALGEDTTEAGVARGEYFHMDLWAARKIYERRPTRHVDVGSRIDGFVAHLLVFMPVEVLDVRPLESRVAGLTFTQADATRLDGFADESLESVSSLHAVEHFGLGRYGDPIDPNAWAQAMLALARVVAPGGRLYFSVPVGRERLRFNAHRILAPRTVLEHFRSLELVSFSGVNDSGELCPDCAPDDLADAYSAAGLFEFTRKA
jgi:hypothetical protein